MKRKEAQKQEFVMNNEIKIFSKIKQDIKSLRPNEGCDDSIKFLMRVMILVFTRMEKMI
jgi:hypothetical protein